MSGFTTQLVYSIRQLYLTLYCDFVAGLPQNFEEYSSDYNYDAEDNNDAPNEEEEYEIGYDINFMSTGETHVVDKGHTIKLPCMVDKYPGK